MLHNHGVFGKTVTLISVQHCELQPSFVFDPSCHPYPLPLPRSDSGDKLHLSLRVPVVFYNRGRFSVFPSLLFYFKINLRVLKSTGQVFCRISLILGLSPVLSCWDLDYGFLRRPQGCVPLLTTSCQVAPVIITNDPWCYCIHPDHLVKEGSARLCHCEPFLTLFLGSESRSPACTQRRGKRNPGGAPTQVIWNSSVGEICLFSSLFLYSIYLHPYAYGCLF